MSSDRPRDLLETKIEIAARDAAEIEEVLLELEDPRWSILEDSIQGKAWIVGIFDDEKTAGSGWTELNQRLPGSVGAIQHRKLTHAEWSDSYKAHFHAWRFGRLHWVPIWERGTYHVPEEEAVLWLDPGLAFGTGNHETTRLCVERLVEHATSTGARGRVVDAGCGSGILALSAAKLGYPLVTGFDNDAEAVRVSQDNAKQNGLSGVVQFRVADLSTELNREMADVVVANILADVLISAARQLIGAINPGGWLILSGILTAECKRVQEVFSDAAPNWSQQSRTLGDWTDVVMVKPQA